MNSYILKKKRLQRNSFIVAILFLFPGLLLRIKEFTICKETLIYMLGMIIFSFSISVYISNFIYDK